MLNPKYAIVGTGALGGYYGGLLAKAGLETHFLMRSGADIVRANGLIVESKDGDFSISAPNVYDDARKMPPCDRIIVATKSTTNHLLPQILPYITHSNSIAIVLQNGLHVERATEDLVGKDRVIGGCAFLCSNKIGPGHIRHLDYGRIEIGDYYSEPSPPNPHSNKLIEVAEELKTALPQVDLSDHLERTRWRKLMWNIPFNGLSVTLNASTDVIMSNPEFRSIAEATVRDVYSAATACGVEIPSNHFDWIMDHTEKMVPYDSSMRLDYLAKRPMEIEAIFGNPYKAALQAGYSAPMIGKLYHELKEIEARNMLDKIGSKN